MKLKHAQVLIKHSFKYVIYGINSGEASASKHPALDPASDKKGASRVIWSWARQKFTLLYSVIVHD